MQKPKRFTSRSELSDEEISDEKEAKLREAYNQTVFNEYISETVAAIFEIEGSMTDSSVSLSSSLHHDRLFECSSSYADSAADEAERQASATVVDQQTGEKIRADIVGDRIWVSPRSEDVLFQTFRDYCLYLEATFNITLAPVVNGGDA